MSKLSELLKQHGLTTGELDYSARAPLNVDELIKFYGKVETYKEWNSNKVSSVWLACTNSCKDTHYFYQVGSHWMYRWPGQSYLVAKALIPLDVLHEVCKAKEDELKEARKKRFEKVKSPRDAVRVTFRDLNIKHQMVGGSPRIDCGPFEIEFKASNDDSNPQVDVAMIYRSYYVEEIQLIKLSIADPDFNKKVQAIATNGKNLKKLMLGETQPENVNGAK